MGFMTTYFSIASISNWCTCSPLGLCYVGIVVFVELCDYARA